MFETIFIPSNVFTCMYVQQIALFNSVTLQQRLSI